MLTKIPLEMLNPDNATAGDIIYFNGTEWVKLAVGADGEILSLSTGLPTWLEMEDSGSNQAFQARIGANQSIPTSVLVKCNFNVSEHESGVSYDNINNRFQPNVPGLYLIFVHIRVQSLGDGKVIQFILSKNGSPATASNRITDTNWTSSSSSSSTSACSYALVRLNGTTDFTEAWLAHSHGSNRDILGTEDRFNVFGGFRVAA